MPIYEYQCLSCGKKTELLQRMNAAPLAACPSCGGEVKKLISSPAVQFKGSGWYVTDYAGKKSGGGSGNSESKSEGTSEGKSESKAESKSEAPKATASESKGSGGSGGGSE
jgi:putative FmdB family regulatory protein